ncbi:MAG TPA: hypothetical protein VLH60_08350, partial [Sedimentisphaerales bacterium]|nr:hypothetical protein [Sedimentisphaerales bacterium]
GVNSVIRPFLVRVFATTCAASKTMPGYSAVPGLLNIDCRVDFRDFALLASNWQFCNAVNCN